MAGKSGGLEAEEGRSFWNRYALAVLATGATVVIRWLSGPWDNLRDNLLLFAIPVTISAWYGGLGPGLLATFLGILGEIGLLIGVPASWPAIAGTTWRVLLFGFAGALVSSLAEGLHATRRRVLASEREAHLAIRRLTETLQRHNRTEAALRLSEERLRLALEAANVGLWDYQPITGDCYCNDPWYRMLELEPGELKPGYETWLGLIHPDDRPRSEQAMADALAGRLSPYSVEFRMRCKSGGWKWVLSRAEVLQRTPEGIAQRMIGVHVDIDRQKRDEELLRSAKETAVRASQAKTDFLAHVTHELRTPLNGVIGNLDLLRQTTLDEQQRHHAQRARSSADLLLSVIDDILDFSKIEAGKLELEQVDFRLGDVLDDVGALLAQRAQTKQLRLSWHCAPELTERQPLRGDPARLRQVLINLVSNAIKFTDQGEVSFRAKLEEPTAGKTGARGLEGVRVRFEVRDTGIGIGPEALPRIFQAFSQADSSTRRGTGLGLAISKHLVERMDGMIGVESAPGQGALFWFVVRLARGDDKVTRWQGDKVTEVALSPCHPVTLSPCHPSLLLVEDNAINAEVASVILTQAGYQVDAVDNGRKAVEAVQHGAYELILMDCQLPEMDGLEAARRIRALERTGVFCRQDGQPVPIVALTATATRQNRDSCFAAGMTDYLSKPLNSSRLLQLIRQRLSWPTGPIEVVEQTLPEEEPSGPAADLEAARERMGGSEELLRKLAGLFLSETDGVVDRLQATVEQGQARELEVTAHRLKGQAATFEARAVAKVAGELERLGRQNQLEPAPPLLAQLRHEIERLREQLALVVGQ